MGSLFREPLPDFPLFRVIFTFGTFFLEKIVTRCFLPLEEVVSLDTSHLSSLKNFELRACRFCFISKAVLISYVTYY